MPQGMQAQNKESVVLIPANLKMRFSGFVYDLTSLLLLTCCPHPTPPLLGHNCPTVSWGDALHTR